MAAPGATGMLLLSFQALGANKTIGPLLVETHTSFFTQSLHSIWLSHSNLVYRNPVSETSQVQAYCQKIKVIYLSLYCPALQG